MEKCPFCDGPTLAKKVDFIIPNYKCDKTFDVSIFIKVYCPSCDEGFLDNIESKALDSLVKKVKNKECYKNIKKVNV